MAGYAQTARNLGSTWWRRRRSICRSQWQRRMRRPLRPVPGQQAKGVSAWYPSIVWSDQKLASDKPGGVGSLWIVEEAGRVVRFDNPAVMHQHDLAGEPPCFAQIMGG